MPKSGEEQSLPVEAWPPPQVDRDPSPPAPPWQAVYESTRFQPLSLLPPLEWLPRYTRAMTGRLTKTDQEELGTLPYSVKGDLIAGFTVGFMLVPQCLAFAMLAGLPVKIGLYSSFAPLLAYAVLGSIRQMQVGPTALMSLLTGQALDAAGLTSDQHRVAGAGVLALAVAGVSLVLGMLRFGFVVDLMSHSVMSAFCTAAGVTIGTSQLKHILGIDMPRKKYWWETVSYLASHLLEIDPPTLVLGGTLLFMLLFLKAWKKAGSAERRSKHLLWRWLPANKASVAFQALSLVTDLSSLASVAIGWVWGLVYRETGVSSVKLVGKADSEGFVLKLPGEGLGSGQDLASLVVSAALMAMVGFLETLAVGGKFASQHRYKFDSNQELLALGIANGATAVMSGYPVTGSFSRAAVNASFGATSQWAGGLTALVVLVAVYVAMPVVETLPLAALAPLIIQGAIGVTHFAAFAVALRAGRIELAVMVVTFLVSLAISVKEGLLAGFVASLLKLLYETAHPNLAVCGLTSDGAVRDIRLYPDAELPPCCALIRVDAHLHFANARRVREFSLRAGQATAGPAKFVILDCSAVNGIDMTSCEMLEALSETLEKRGQGLILANLKGALATTLRATGLDDVIRKHGGHLCLRLDHALAVVEGLDPAAPKVAAESMRDLDHRIVVSASLSKRWTRQLDLTFSASVAPVGCATPKRGIDACSPVDEVLEESV